MQTQKEKDKEKEKVIKLWLDSPQITGVIIEMSTQQHCFFFYCEKASLWVFFLLVTSEEL